MCCQPFQLDDRLRQLALLEQKSCNAHKNEWFWEGRQRAVVRSSSLTRSRAVSSAHPTRKRRLGRRIELDHVSQFCLRVEFLVLKGVDAC